MKMDLIFTYLLILYFHILSLSLRLEIIDAGIDIGKMGREQ